MKVQDVMTRNPRSVTPDTPVRDAACVMKDEDVGFIPVIEQGRLVGVITDRDIAVRIIAAGLDASTPVRDAMSGGNIATLRPDDDVDRAMDSMASEKVRRIPVVDDRGLVVGVVAQADIVLKAKDERKAEKTIERISEPGAGRSL